MRILSIDTATRSGWAFSADGAIQSGVFDASIRTKATKTMEADHFGKRFHSFQHWVRNAIRISRPDLISYERIVGGASAGGRTTLVQKGLEAILWLEAYRAGENPIPLWTFAAATIKKWATGSGVLTHESKILVSSMAFKKFSDQEWEMTSKGPDDNQADALWIMDLTRAVYNEVAGVGQGPQNDITDVFDARAWEDSDLTTYASKVTAAKWLLAKLQ